MAEEKEYVFVAGGECAVDHCYIYGIDWCRDSGCVDLMGSWDCPTKETCDGMRAVKDVLEDWIDASALTEPVPAVMKKTQEGGDWCATQPGRPGDECWNFSAWTYSSDDDFCNLQWTAWDEYCYGCEYNEACMAVDTDVNNAGDDFWEWDIEWEHDGMMQQLKKDHTNPKMAKQMFKNKKAQKIALLSAAQAPQQEEESFNYSGAIVGTSVAVLGVAAAIFAARRCSKREEGDFERALL